MSDKDADAAPREQYCDAWPNTFPDPRAHVSDESSQPLRVGPAIAEDGVSVHTATSDHASLHANAKAYVDEIFRELRILQNTSKNCFNFF